MKAQVLVLLIASVAIVSCDPQPCDEHDANRYNLRFDLKECKTDGCIEWVLKRADDARKRCEESRRQ